MIGKLKLLSFISRIQDRILLFVHKSGQFMHHTLVTFVVDTHPVTFQVLLKAYYCRYRTLLLYFFFVWSSVLEWDPEPYPDGVRKEDPDLELIIQESSVPAPDPDPPDPHVFGPPGSGSTSQRYGSGSGSGSFYHHAKIVRKTLIPSIL
jgi:hypothetical protein